MITFVKQQCKKYHIDWKFIKFLFVGVINTAFSYSIYALFIFLNFHYSVATLVSTVLGVLFNFKTTGAIVFKNKSNRLIFKFVTAYCIIYVLNVIGLKLFDMIHFDLYIAGFILIFPMAVLSFILMKKFVFVNKTENKEGQQ